MELKIKYFGMLAEYTGCYEESRYTDAPSLDALRKELEAEHLLLTSVPYRMAHNLKLNTNQELKEGDEVALLPPFAGG